MTETTTPQRRGGRRGKMRPRGLLKYAMGQLRPPHMQGDARFRPEAMARAAGRFATYCEYEKISFNMLAARLKLTDQERRELLDGAGSPNMSSVQRLRATNVYLAQPAQLAHGNGPIGKPPRDALERLREVNYGTPVAEACEAFAGFLVELIRERDASSLTAGEIAGNEAELPSIEDS